MRVVGDTNVMLRGDVDTWLQLAMRRGQEAIFKHESGIKNHIFFEHAQGLNVTVFSNGLSV